MSQPHKIPRCKNTNYSINMHQELKKGSFPCAAAGELPRILSTEILPCSHKIVTVPVMGASHSSFPYILSKVL